jgi:hypothetical protein
MKHMHKFKEGDFVRFDRSLRYLNIVPGQYRVAKRLPERHGELSYRMKSAHESHERTANERDLIGDLIDVEAKG